MSHALADQPLDGAVERRKRWLPHGPLQWLLLVWFVVFTIIDLWSLVPDGWTGFDAKIYYRGSAAWIAGTDPWAASATNLGSAGFSAPYHYAGSPTTVIGLAPFTVLPESVFVAGFVVISALAAIWIVRACGLPWYWLLFPPLVDGVVSGNPGILMLAFLVGTPVWLRALAPLLKVYAVVPLAAELRWKPLAIAAVLAGLSFVLWPGLWQQYLGEFGAISARLSDESSEFSAYRWLDSYPILFLITAVAVVVIALRDRREAGWLAVPALWPATQFHYSTMAMPVATPFLGLILSIPRFGMPALAVCALAVVSVPSIARRVMSWSVASRLLAPSGSAGPGG